MTNHFGIRRNFKLIEVIRTIIHKLMLILILNKHVAGFVIAIC